jgi:hypothetical protein
LADAVQQQASVGTAFRRRLYRGQCHARRLAGAAGHHGGMLACHPFLHGRRHHGQAQAAVALQQGARQRGAPAPRPSPTRTVMLA